MTILSDSLYGDRKPELPSRDEFDFILMADSPERGGKTKEQK